MLTEKQFDLLKKAVKLKEENPELDIFVCACSDDLMEDHKWTTHTIDRVEVNPWYAVDDDKILTDEDDIRESLRERFEEETDDEEDIEILINQHYRKYVKNAICIYTSA